jgi:hypothetical protein
MKRKDFIAYINSAIEVFMSDTNWSFLLQPGEFESHTEGLERGYKKTAAYSVLWVDVKSSMLAFDDKLSMSLIYHPNHNPNSNSNSFSILGL